MLAQCDAYSTIYDASGVPAPGVLVTLQHVEDAMGNAILLEPQRTTTDSQGQFHFTLPRNARAWLNARATTLYSCNGGTQMIVPDAATGAFIPTTEVTPPPVGFTVAPPLTYIGNILSIPRASASQDGYLSAADFATFASFQGALPEGNDSDVQMKNGALFAPSRLRQVDGLGAGSYPFGTRNSMTLLSPLVANVAGSAYATTFRIMDVDDGAGNAQWFEMTPSYGAMNFCWNSIGSGQPSREFLIDNGRTHITIGGQYRGGFDEGDFVWIAIKDGGAYRTSMLLQGDNAVGGKVPGLHIAVQQSGGTGVYQFHFDHDGLLLPNDPVLPLHAATRQYVDAHGGSGGGAPAGSGSELQFRASATSFGAAAGSTVDGSGNVVIANTLASTSAFWLRNTTGNISCGMGVVDVTGAQPTPASVFYAIHGSTIRGFIYFGRGGVHGQVASVLSFYTGNVGDDLRRMFISTNGSVHIAEQTIADSATALTVSAPGNGGFSRALLVNGLGEMSADPTTPLGIATKQFVESHGAAPAGAGSELQYRASASAFGAVSSSVNGSGQVTFYNAMNLHGGGPNCDFLLDSDYGGWSVLRFQKVAGSLSDGANVVGGELQTIVYSGTPSLSVGQYSATLSVPLNCQATPAIQSTLASLKLRATGGSLGAVYIATSDTGLSVQLEGSANLCDLTLQATYLTGTVRFDARGGVINPANYSYGELQVRVGGFTPVCDLSVQSKFYYNVDFMGPITRPGVPLKGIDGSGTAVSIFEHNYGGGNAWSIGPYSNGGNPTGAYVVIRAGKGDAYSGGSAFIHGPLERWTFYANIWMGAGYTLNIYDASVNSNFPLKIGPAGSGPGGTGRMIYVD